MSADPGTDDTGYTFTARSLDDALRQVREAIAATELGRVARAYLAACARGGVKRGRPVQAVARELGVTPSTASRRIKQARRAGYLRAITDDTDRITIPEAAEIAGVTRMTIYNWAKAGWLCLDGARTTQDDVLAAMRTVGGKPRRVPSEAQVVEWLDTYDYARNGERGVKYWGDAETRGCESFISGLFACALADPTTDLRPKGVGVRRALANEILLQQPTPARTNNAPRPRPRVAKLVRLWTEVPDEERASDEDVIAAWAGFSPDYRDRERSRLATPGPCSAARRLRGSQTLWVPCGARVSPGADRCAQHHGPATEV